MLKGESPSSFTESMLVFRDMLSHLDCHMTGFVRIDTMLNAQLTHIDSEAYLAILE